MARAASTSAAVAKTARTRRPAAKTKTTKRAADVVAVVTEKPVRPPTLLELVLSTAPLAFSASPETSIDVICRRFLDLADEFERADKLEVIYNLIGEACSGSVSADALLADANDGVHGWGSAVFARYREQRKLADRMVERPLEVREGDEECVKCKQRKVIVVEQQTRSADEGFTYKVICYNAKCKYIQTL